MIKKLEQTILHNEVIFFNSNCFQSGLHDVLFRRENKQGKSR